MTDVLLDSNILLRLSQPGHADEPVAMRAVDTVMRRHRCVIVPQTIYEFWVVATCPVKVNGIGLTAEEAASERERFLDLFTLVRDERSIFEHWMKFTADYKVTGLPAHDCRYVAAMKRHGLGCLLSFNSKDFQRYKEFTILTPADLLSDPSVLDS